MKRQVRKILRLDRSRCGYVPSSALQRAIASKSTGSGRQSPPASPAAAPCLSSRRELPCDEEDGGDRGARGVGDGRDVSISPKVSSGSSLVRVQKPELSPVDDAAAEVDEVVEIELDSRPGVSEDKKALKHNSENRVTPNNANQLFFSIVHPPPPAPLPPPPPINNPSNDVAVVVVVE
jgi:hypothetical protein